MRALALHPVDTWFFREGTPFEAGGSPQADVGGVFPPYPSTVAGAVRVALALRNGWSGRGRWSPEVEAVLGTGPEELGQLSLSGPVLLEEEQPLFALPRHVVGLRGEDGGWAPRALLQPGPPVCCDLGEGVRLPVSPEGEERLEPAERAWLTRAGLEAVLAGRPPRAEEVRRSEELWREEPRIGLKRERDTRTAREGMLYSTRHTRPRAGVSLGVVPRGLPPGWELPLGQLLPLGGESRLAECQEWKAEVALAAPREEVVRTGRFTLVALTPVLLDAAIFHGARPLLELGRARVVSACLGRPLRIGGWDSLRRAPLPLRNALPAGSTLFCEAEEPGALGPLLEEGRPPLHLGAWRAAGFGWVALGRWSTLEEAR
jgi:CRISPR-associated protein Cmr3